MLDASWLGKIAAGHFESELVPLTLTNGYGDRFEGQGLLSWSTQAGTRIEALTNGAEALLRRFGRAPCPIGHLIPDEYYLRLEGKTRHGETVVIGRITPDDYSIHTGHPTVIWKIPQKNVLGSVAITDPTCFVSNVVYTEALLSPVLLSWPRRSDTIYENPHFGVQSSNFDWLAFEYSGGHVAARRLDNDLARVRVEHSSNGKPDVSLAISLAIGFVSGRNVSILAKEARNRRLLTRSIYRPGKGVTRNRFSPPLSDHPELAANWEPLLSKATEFFCTDMGKQAADLLHMCHMSVDSTFTIHALVVCVVLESLVKLLASSRPTKTTITAEQKDSIVACLREIGLDDRVVDRFSGFIGKMDEISPKNRLRAWAAEGLLGIGRDDAKAWDRLRNPAVHGRLLMDGKDKAEGQKHWTALRRVKNLINKLLLNAMGYEGGYYDHAECQTKAFACVSLTELADRQSDAGAQGGAGTKRED